MGHIAAARNYSFFLLILVFMDFNIGSLFIQRIELLNEVKKLCVIESANRMIGGQYLNYEIITSTEFGEATIRPEPDSVNMLIILDSGTENEEFIFKPGDNSYLTRLKDLGADLDIRLGNDFLANFNEFENKLLRSKIKIPGIQFSEFRSQMAIWIISLLIFLILLQMRNLLKKILRHTEKEIYNPWLILDSTTPLEILVSTIWIFLILLASFITSFFLVVLIMSKSEFNFLLWGIAIFIISSSCWLSIVVFSQIINIRHLRSHNINITSDIRSNDFLQGNFE